MRRTPWGSVANFSDFHARRDCCIGSPSGPSDVFDGTMFDFKSVHHPKALILHSAFFYVYYGISFRGLDEILATKRLSPTLCQSHCIIMPRDQACSAH